MKIRIKLYTILKKYAKGKVLEDNTIILHEDTTLQGLFDYLNLPKNHVCASYGDSNPK